MSKQFAQDLRLARRKAGLTQTDLAHLLDISEKKVSKLELGRKLPDLPRICELSLVYGRNFESLFAELVELAKAKLARQLRTLSHDVRRDVTTFNRDATLERIAQRLGGSSTAVDEDA